MPTPFGYTFPHAVLVRCDQGRAAPFRSSHSQEGFVLFRSRTAALVLIIVGAVFLLSNLGWIPRIGPFLHQWWPLILIIVGVLMLVQRS